VVVTNNASDFRRLYATQSLHAGLVIIIPSASHPAQQQLFRGALDELAAFGELVNHVLEVDIEGEEVTFNFLRPPPGEQHLNLPRCRCGCDSAWDFMVS
jgi:hypothetical protein